jgi:hypothetical protein
MSDAKYRRTIAVTAFVVSFFGLLLWLRQSSIDSPIAAAVFEVVFIGWAIAIRWRVVAGALVGLLFSELTPALDSPPDVLQIMVCMATGALLGFASEGLRQKAPKRPDHPSPPTALPSA